MALRETESDKISLERVLQIPSEKNIKTRILSL
jgi:hypothetical protein